MGLISDTLGKGGEAAAFSHCSPFPLAVMLPIEVKNLTLLLLVFEHHDISRQWIASVPCHEDFLSGESGSCCVFDLHAKETPSHKAKANRFCIKSLATEVVHLLIFQAGWPSNT